MGTVNFFNLGDDLEFNPAAVIKYFRRKLSPKDHDFLLSVTNIHEKPHIFNRYLMDIVKEHMVKRLKTFFQSVRDINPKIIILFVSILPIPNRFSLLDKTIHATNDSIMAYFHASPNSIYIPAAKSFLNKDSAVKLDLFHHDRIHLHKINGVPVLSKRIAQYLNRDQIMTKILSQVKPKRKRIPVS